jgi:broad specificity phosphatase PhoE
MSDASEAKVILVRHAPVAARHRGICYGRSDVELGAEGKILSAALANELAVERCDRIFHSGLQRTRHLAERLAVRLGCPEIACEALQERDFGAWELQAWDAIYAKHGDEMLRMVTEPDEYRPGGGETTFEMRDRVLAWFDALPHDGATIAIMHGGPIAALLGTLRGMPATEWPRLIPACGQEVRIQRQLRRPCNGTYELA